MTDENTTNEMNPAGMTATELETYISNANLSWNTGRPILTDEEYDLFWRELHKRKPSSSVLYHTSQDPSLQKGQVHHVKKIPGTQKAFNMEDLVPFLTRFKGQRLVIEPKYDGVAIMVYRNQEGHSIVLHGDGEKGRDVSHHPWNVPQHLVRRPAWSAEAIIPNFLWQPHFGANPRNAVSGLVQRESPAEEIHHYVNLLPHEGGPLREYITADTYLPELEELLTECYAKWKKYYPMDGLMIKLASPEERVKKGFTSTYYHWSVAWKPPIQTEWTTVTEITYHVSKHGRVIPLVHYKPITLCGTTNQKVTANNMHWLINKGISEGCRILVGKAGEIIPQIIEVSSTEKPTPPVVCPICKDILTWEGRHMVCDNPDCIAQLVKRISHFYSPAGVMLKGIGENMLEELLQDDTLRKEFSDHPWILLTITKNSYLRERTREILGTAHAENILQAVEDLKEKKNIANFIAALGYKGLGYKKALSMLQYFYYNEPMKQNPSAEVKNNFLRALREVKALGDSIPEFFLPCPKPAKITYCITGTLSAEREEIIKYLEKFSWHFTSTVTKNTDYLILGDLKKPTTKTKAAEKFGTKIIAEHQIGQLLKGEES